MGNLITWASKGEFKWSGTQDDQRQMYNTNIEEKIRGESNLGNLGEGGGGGRSDCSRGGR